MSFFTRFRRLLAKGRPAQARTTAGDDTGSRRGSWWRPRLRQSAAAPALTSGGWWRVAGAWATTTLACLLVLFALIGPNQVSLLTPGAFARLPVEGLVGVILVLVLPARVRPVVAALAGLALGLLTIVKIVDMGFYEVLDRPFDLVLDWILFGDAVDFLTRSTGRAAAIGAVVAAVVLAATVLILVTLSVLRLTRLVARHRTTATRSVAVLGVVWATCAVLGAQIVPGEPVAAKSAATLAYDRALQVHAGLRDRQAFARESAVDAFRDTPGEKLLTGLRGKDVMITFVESYGQVALTDPKVNALLDAGTGQLRAAGFSARSAWLTSPTAGGGSWLAQSTLMSGLWINNQQRYRNLVSSDRLSLNAAFHRAGWRTVGVQPAINRAWPEGDYYGFDQLYTFQNTRYKGQCFNFCSLPDQYTLSAFQQDERAKPGRPGTDGASGVSAGQRQPVMADIALLSSHTPWAPLPHMIDWTSVGDGSIYNGMPGKGQQPGTVWHDRGRIRAAYLQSIEYSLTSLITYLETYGDDDLVLVFLGDHQPAPIITGGGASRNAPITLVAKDPDVLNRISGWDWTDGLKPGPHAPVWRMDSFRDRFLTAFGPQAGSTPPAR